MPAADPHLSTVLTELEARGLLLASDATLPNVTTLITGEPVKGSSWGHPLARAVNEVIRALEQHEDVIWAPLINGKATFLHRKLWPAFLGVALGRQTWQVDGLSKGARMLLKSLDEGSLDRSGDKQAVAELEARLLIRSYTIVNDRAQKEQRLETWRAWMLRRGIEGPFPAPEEAKALLLKPLEGFDFSVPWA
jgi:hypothetical protein